MNHVELSSELMSLQWPDKWQQPDMPDMRLHKPERYSSRSRTISHYIAVCTRVPLHDEAMSLGVHSRLCCLAPMQPYICTPV